MKLDYLEKVYTKLHLLSHKLEGKLNENFVNVLSINTNLKIKTMPMMTSNIVFE